MWHLSRGAMVSLSGSWRSSSHLRLSKGTSGLGAPILAKDAPWCVRVDGSDFRKLYLKTGLVYHFYSSTIQQYPILGLYHIGIYDYSNEHVCL